MEEAGLGCRKTVISLKQQTIHDKKKIDSTCSYNLIVRIEIYLSKHRNAKPLRNIADPDWEPGTTGHKTQKENPLLIGECFQCLPQPAYHSVTLIGAIFVPSTNTTYC